MVVILEHQSVNMSFYRISDPKKRDAMVEDYIATSKRLRERSLDEKLGELAYQRDLNKSLNPIIKSNQQSSAVITKELKPIRSEIEEMNKHLKEKAPIIRGVKRKFIHESITDLLEGDHSRQDLYYGVQKDLDDQYVLGDKVIKVDADQNILVDDVVYKGTPGLWSLIMHISPKNYTPEDYNNYKQLVLQTDLINHPRGVHHNSRPQQTSKYRNYLIKIIEENEKKNDGEASKVEEKQGDGIQFLPSSIKGLFEKLKLLAGEYIAGNTATRNELVAVLDELQRRQLISEKEYTSINTLISP